MDLLNFKELQPAAGISEARISYHSWSEPDGWKGLALVVVSDAMGPHGFSGPGGFHTLSDGGRIEWQFKKTGSKISTVTVCDRDYDPAFGSFFVVATKGAKPRVVQLKRDLTRMKQGEIVSEDVVGVIRGAEEIGSFFAEAAKPANVP